MKNKMQLVQHLVIFGVFVACAQPVLSAEKTIDVFLLNDNKASHGIGDKVGTITFQESAKGLIVRPHLKGLSGGTHGFHIHENASCNGGEKDNVWVAGLEAGGHLDPKHTGKHLGPNGNGHLGDLPTLVVDQNGETQFAVEAERLTLKDIEGHSVVIHKGGDNYSDTPSQGKDDDRIACGVIK